MRFLSFFPRQRSALPLLLSSLLCVVVVFALAEAGRAATKSLMLTPVRAIFTDRQRTVSIHVNNIGEEPITYEVSLVTMRRDKDGQLREVATETEEERQVKSMIRFSPRRATIKPSSRQIVKLMVRKPENLPPGEYQTRLSLKPIPDSQKAAKTVAGPGGKSAFNIDLLVQSTIPVIIQNGDIAPQVSPTAISLKPGAKASENLAAEVKLSRSGMGSAFGNISVEYIPANDPKAARKIGFAQGVAMYIPRTEASFIVPLENITRQELASGQVRVSFLHNTGTIDRRQRVEPGSVKEFSLR